MSLSATAAPQIRAPLADAASPLLQGSENCVQILALTLLRLSTGIALLPALLLSFLTAVTTRRPRAQAPWYLSPSDQDDIDALSPRAQRTLRRLLAIIGWSVAGYHNRGMRPRARTGGRTASNPRPTNGPRAPPCPG
jgi:hypothetical protein